MSLPDIFALNDPSEVKLASYFEEMYDYLLDEGVPEDRLPGPWHMLSRLVKCLDPELFRDWLDAYISVEAEEDYDEDEEGESQESSFFARPKPKRRPSYLRALDSTALEDSEEEPKNSDDPPE